MGVKKKSIKQLVLNNRKDKIWQKFCKLSNEEKYAMSIELDEAYENFRDYLIDPKGNYGGSLKELEADVNERLKSSSSKRRKV